MESIKDSLKRELQTIAFTEQSKIEVVHNVKKVHLKNEHALVWRYRTILTLVILLGCGLALLNGNVIKQLSTTQIVNAGTLAFSDIFVYDWVKTILLGIAFLIAYALLKVCFKVKNTEFPMCANCGTACSRAVALKIYSRKKGSSCAQCGAVNYQTRKSLKKTLAFQMLTPFMIIIANMFDNVVLGMLVYLGFLIILSIYVIPFLVELQTDNPKDEPYW
ncbi:TIGR04104 family putative zinc finger protein [Sporosarcina sp. D27]|uniref:TIGR04104 family putative zinc finger protein n=1 Tax=Sporosarcina sp. D27 TaxID=1382305 RepID=UPI00046EA2A6|nr:TIGR04104 family putative zinc finger protein [Sporosarcina sp. D27]